MSSHKLITCLIPNHRSMDAIRMLKEEENIVTANRYSARGGSSNSGYEFQSIDVMTVIVESAQADSIFEKLFFFLEINQPGKGLMYQQAVRQASAYTLPELTDREG